MANKFDFLTKDVVEEAANLIDTEGIPPRREGKAFSVQIGSKSYPYKLLVTKAAELSGIELLSADFSSNPANRSIFLDKTGFKAVKIEEEMGYFKLEEIEAYQKNKGKNIAKTNEDDLKLIESLHAKLVYVTELLQAELNSYKTRKDGKIWNPVKEGKLIKSYLWYRNFLTKRMYELDLCLAFSIESDFYIRVESDRWDDRLYKRKAILDLREREHLVEKISFDKLIGFGRYDVLLKTITDFYNEKFNPNTDKLLRISETHIGLLASDNTGWQEEHLADSLTKSYTILWNSKRPSGTNDTLKELSESIRRYGYFDLGYLIGNNLSYKARIVAFATRDKELQDWKEKYPDVDLQSEMNSYTDRSKSAKIVFLCSSFEKASPPIPKTELSLLDDFDYPRQDNLSPYFMSRKSTTQNKEDSFIDKDHDMNKKEPALNQILFGPPGTGKTYHTVNKALEILNPDFDLSQDREKVKVQYEKLVNEGRIVFTTFHQSMSYEDFIEGIKPQEPKKEGDPISYKVEDGIFKKICYKANPSFGNIERVIEDFKKDISEDDGKLPQKIEGKGTTFDVIYRGTNVFYVQPLATTKDKPWYPVNINNIIKYFQTDDITGIYNATYVREIISYLKKYRGLKKGHISKHNELPYVLIIDEINRGNVSQVFGELITLIEKDKRLSEDERLEVQLPYSKESFGVPNNLYIIGTMNTADRSVEALDTALRRRFSFEEVAPKPEIISRYGKLKDNNGIINVEGNIIDLVKLLITINKRIEILLDKDHLIGHSYFMNVKDLPGLKEAFGKQVIPLLQEYFYGDYGKVSLVLGEGFCRGVKVNNVSESFAEVKDYDIDSFSEKIVYTINDPIVMTQNDFIIAVRILLKEPDQLPASGE